jgi:hypothetical protein
MLRLIHCHVRKTGDEPGHGQFDFLAEAANVGKAKALLRAELERPRAEGNVIDGPVKVYVSDVIEMSAVLESGVVGRYEWYDGEERTTFADLLPGGEGEGCVLLEPGEAERDGVVEPLAVYGSKGG